MNALIKYKDVKLLITKTEGDASLLTSNIEAIEELDKRVKAFYLSQMSPDADSEVRAIEAEREKLSHVRDELGLIGVPFDNHDAELYALDRRLDYEILELHGNTGNQNASKEKNSHLHMRCRASDKAAWVKQAQRENLKLTEWVEKTLNAAAEKYS